jgi:hypothetical protein
VAQWNVPSEPGLANTTTSVGMSIDEITCRQSILPWIGPILLPISSDHRAIMDCPGQHHVRKIVAHERFMSSDSRQMW